MKFEFEVPLSFFEKADAPAGKQRRIGGIISTDKEDQQEETVLQRGLNFNPFLKGGWFNDNHARDMDGVLGYPESVALFRKGETLPDGTTAKRNGTWAEGYLLATERANKVWELGKALQSTNRRLGFSIEGKVLRRKGPLRKTIAEALVRNVAITHCPVNDDSRLEILARSIQAIEAGEDVESRLERVEKALTVGGGEATWAHAPEGTQSGEGAGTVLARESLEHRGGSGRRRKKKKLHKSMTFGEAAEWFHRHVPHASADTVMRLVDTTLALKQRGLL